MSTVHKSQETPKVEESRKHLTPTEAAQLIAGAGSRGRHKDRDRLLLRLTYRHGLRASEAVRLRWADVNLDGGTMLVRRAKGGVDATHSLAKGDIRDLRTLRQRATGPCVFETERGDALSVDTLQYICREAGKAAGLPFQAHPHQLRHGAGYALVNDRTDIRLVQAFLGHKSIQSTAIYTALSPRLLEEVRIK